MCVCVFIVSPISNTYRKYSEVRLKVTGVKDKSMLMADWVFVFLIF